MSWITPSFSYELAFTKTVISSKAAKIWQLSRRGILASKYFDFNAALWVKIPKSFCANAALIPDEFVWLKFIQLLKLK